MQLFVLLRRSPGGLVAVNLEAIVLVEPRQGGSTLSLGVPGAEAGTLHTIDVDETVQQILQVLEGHAGVLRR